MFYNVSVSYTTYSMQKPCKCYHQKSINDLNEAKIINRTRIIILKTATGVRRIMFRFYQIPWRSLTFTTSLFEYYVLYINNKFIHVTLHINVLHMCV